MQENQVQVKLLDQVVQQVQQVQLVQQVDQV